MNISDIKPNSFSDSLLKIKLKKKKRIATNLYSVTK